MKRSPIPLQGIKSIAFVMSPRLGDALISMVIVHNLRRNGYTVTVFNNHLTALKNWFPDDIIKPLPTEIEGRTALESFDLLLHMADYNILFEADKWHPRVVVLDDYEVYHRALSMVDIQLAVCRELLGLTNLVRDNGLTPPNDVQSRIYRNRVVIHPTASSRDKEWLPQRFIALAQRLQQQGYEPVFVISPDENIPWIAANNFNYVAHHSLDAVARFLYESAWFIGNDSGVGHLASNVGIPTVTVLSRKSVKCRWRPGWAPGEALLPWMPLFIRPWKKNYWKYFISVEKVMNALQKNINSVQIAPTEPSGAQLK